MIETIMLALASPNSLIDSIVWLIGVGLVFWLLFWLIGFVRFIDDDY